MIILPLNSLQSFKQCNPSAHVPHLQHIQDNNHMHQLLIVRCHNKLVSEITICVKANNDVSKEESIGQS